MVSQTVKKMNILIVTENGSEIGFVVRLPGIMDGCQPAFHLNNLARTT